MHFDAAGAVRPRRWKVTARCRRVATQASAAHYRYVNRTSSCWCTEALSSRSISNKSCTSQSLPSHRIPNDPHPNRRPEGTRPCAQGEGLVADDKQILPSPRAWGEGLGMRGLRGLGDRFLIASAPTTG